MVFKKSKDKSDMLANIWLPKLGNEFYIESNIESENINSEFFKHAVNIKQITVQSMTVKTKIWCGNGTSRSQGWRTFVYFGNQKVN